jgi:hypothetical protein
MKAWRGLADRANCWLIAPHSLLLFVPSPFWGSANPMMSGRNATISSINEMEVGAVIVGDDDDTWGKGKDGGRAKRAETSDA